MLLTTFIIPTNKRPVVCMSRRLLHIIPGGIVQWAQSVGVAVAMMANKNTLFVMLVGIKIEMH